MDDKRVDMKEIVGGKVVFADHDDITIYANGAYYQVWVDFDEDGELCVNKFTKTQPPDKRP